MTVRLLFFCISLFSLTLNAGDPPAITKTYQGQEAETFLWKLAAPYGGPISARGITRDSLTSYDRSCMLEVKQDSQNYCSMEISFSFCMFQSNLGVTRIGSSGATRSLSLADFAEVFVDTKRSRGLDGLFCREFRD